MEKIKIVFHKSYGKSYGNTEVLNPCSEFYHKPTLFHNLSPVLYLAKVLTSSVQMLDSQEIKKILTNILVTYPLIMYSKYQERNMWSLACICGRADIVEFLLQYKNRGYPNIKTIPDWSSAVDINGNGLLMAPVDVKTLNVLTLADYFNLCELLNYKNKTTMSNIFHYHCKHVTNCHEREVSLRFLMWVAELWRRVPFVISDRPDVNLINKNHKTPLQVAIENNNPEAAIILIESFGACWFKPCIVVSTRHDAPPDKLSYLELAVRVKSKECEDLLKTIKAKYQIYPNKILLPSDNLVCSVCLSSENFSEFYQLPCKHWLHCTCLMDVCTLCSSMDCPKCRQEMGQLLKKRSPPTVYRVKYNSNTTEEEEQAQFLPSHEEMSNHLRLITQKVFSLIPPPSEMRDIQQGNVGSNTTSTQVMNSAEQETKAAVAAAGTAVGDRGSNTTSTTKQNIKKESNHSLTCINLQCFCP